MSSSRPSWDEYFMNIAHTVKQRATCLTRQVGAVLVKDKRITATGYNGTPMRTRNCNENGCERCNNRITGSIKSGQDLDKCSCCHAEENSIVQSALHGNSTKGSTLYTTFVPCTQCAKMIINAGIVKVVASENYADELGTKLLKEAGIELAKYNGTVKKVA